MSETLRKWTRNMDSAAGPLLLQEQNAFVVRIPPATTLGFLALRQEALRKHGVQMNPSRPLSEPQFSRGAVDGRSGPLHPVGSNAQSAGNTFPANPGQTKRKTAADQLENVRRNLEDAPQRKNSLDYPSTSNKTGRDRVITSTQQRQQNPQLLNPVEQPLKRPEQRGPDFETAVDENYAPEADRQVAVGVCDFCHRQFSDELRLEKHKLVCMDAPTRKQTGQRGAFDARLHRVQAVYDQNHAGSVSATDVQEMLQIDDRSSAFSRTDSTASGRLKPKRPSWRQQSAQLQQVLRSARAESGGTDQSAPDADFQSAAPIDDGRVECPGCSRRFAPDTADRHIPKCLEKTKLAAQQQRTNARAK